MILLYCLLRESNNLSDSSEKEKSCGILTLVNQQRLAEKSMPKRQNNIGSRGPGRPPSIISEGCSLENITAVEEVNRVFFFFYEKYKLNNEN